MLDRRDTRRERKRARQNYAAGRKGDRLTDGRIGEREKEKEMEKGSRMVRGEGRATSEQSARKIEKEEITTRRIADDDEE